MSTAIFDKRLFLLYILILIFPVYQFKRPEGIKIATLKNMERCIVKKPSLDFKIEMVPVNYPHRISFTVRIEGIDIDKIEMVPIILKAKEDLNITTVTDLIESRYDLAKAIERKISEKFPKGKPIPEYGIKIINILIP